MVNRLLMLASISGCIGAASRRNPLDRPLRARRLAIVRAACVLVALIGAALPPSCAEGGEASFRAGDSVTLTADQTLTGDLYAAGDQVMIACDVPGDLFVAAGEIEILGHVSGSVYASGVRVSLKGEIDGTVRVTGNEVSIQSQRIGRDLFVAGVQVTVDPTTTIEGSTFATGQTLRLAGTFQGTTRAAAQQLRLAGTFRRPVHVAVDQEQIPFIPAKPVEFTLESTTVLEDELTVQGRAPLVQEGASLASEPVIVRKPLPEAAPAGGVPVVVRSLLSRWLQFSTVGLMFALLFPSRSRVFLRNFGARPLRVVAMGPLFHLLLFLASVAVVLGAASVVLGLLAIEFTDPIPAALWVGMVCVAMLAGGGSILSLLVAPTLFGGWLSRTFLRWLPGFRGDAIYLPMITGGLLVAAVSIIPIAGLILLLIMIVFSAGIFFCGTLPPPTYEPPVEGSKRKGYERIK